MAKLLRLFLFFMFVSASGCNLSAHDFTHKVLQEVQKGVVKLQNCLYSPEQFEQMCKDLIEEQVLQDGTEEESFFTTETAFISLLVSAVVVVLGIGIYSMYQEKKKQDDILRRKKTFGGKTFYGNESIASACRASEVRRKVQRKREPGVTNLGDLDYMTSRVSLLAKDQDIPGLEVKTRQWVYDPANHKMPKK